MLAFNEVPRRNMSLFHRTVTLDLTKLFFSSSFPKHHMYLSLMSSIEGTRAFFLVTLTSKFPTTPKPSQTFTSSLPVCIWQGFSSSDDLTAKTGFYHGTSYRLGHGQHPLNNNQHKNKNKKNLNEWNILEQNRTVWNSLEQSRPVWNSLDQSGTV